MTTSELAPHRHHRQREQLPPQLGRLLGPQRSGHARGRQRQPHAGGEPGAFRAVGCHEVAADHRDCCKPPAPIILYLRYSTVHSTLLMERQGRLDKPRPPLHPLQQAPPRLPPGPRRRPPRVPLQMGLQPGLDLRPGPSGRVLVWTVGQSGWDAGADAQFGGWACGPDCSVGGGSGVEGED